MRHGAIVAVVSQLGDEKTNRAVYVYRDGKAHLTPVRVGYKDGKEAEVLSGVTIKDCIIVNPIR